MAHKVIMVIQEHNLFLIEKARELRNRNSINKFIVTKVKFDNNLLIQFVLIRSN